KGFRRQVEALRAAVAKLDECRASLPSERCRGSEESLPSRFGRGADPAVDAVRHRNEAPAPQGAPGFEQGQDAGYRVIRSRQKVMGPMTERPFDRAFPRGEMERRAVRACPDERVPVGALLTQLLDVHASLSF